MLKTVVVLQVCGIMTCFLVSGPSYAARSSRIKNLGGPTLEALQISKSTMNSKYTVLYADRNLLFYCKTNIIVLLEIQYLRKILILLY